MPQIRNIGQQASAPGPVDYAIERPNQAFAQAGRDAKEAGGILDQLAQEDAAVEGLKALSDFDAASDARALELQKAAKTPDGFGQLWAGDWDQRAQALVDATSNDRVAAFLQQRLFAGQARAHAPGYAWEAQQKEALQATQFGEAANQIANGIMKDPARFPEALANVQAMLEAGGFEPAKREALWAATAGQFAQSYLSGLPPAEALQRLQGGELDKYLGADAKIALANHFAAAVRQAETEGRVNANKAETLAFLQGAKAINDYGNGVGPRPVFTPEMRAAMGEDNALRLDVQLGDADARIGKSQAGMNKVVTALALGQRLDQSDGDDRKAVDQHFQQAFLPTLEQVSPEQRVDAIISQVNKYGVLPDSFASSMVTVPLATGSPDQKAQAAQIYARLAQEQPAYAGSTAISDVTRRTAILINNYREAGMSAEDAARAADADLKIEKKTGKDIGAEYRELISNGQGKPSKSEQFLQSQFDEGWFSSAPALQAGVTAAFDNLASHEFATNGGNIELAQKAALDKLRTQYGVSRVNGAPVLMRHAPELFYSLPGMSRDQNSVWIKQQAVEDLNANSASPIAPENIQIVPYVTATGRQVTGPDGKPAYALTVVGPDGIPYPQMDYTQGSPNYGKPLAWVPDTAKATAVFNSATELRKTFNLEVARYNRDFPTMTRQQREQGRKDILKKYNFNPGYRDRLEWLSPLVRPERMRREQRSELESATGVGGELSGIAGLTGKAANDKAREIVTDQLRALGYSEDAANDPAAHWALLKDNNNTVSDKMQAGKMMARYGRGPDQGVYPPEEGMRQSTETWASRGPGDVGEPVASFRDNSQQVNDLLRSMETDYARMHQALGGMRAGEPRRQEMLAASAAELTRKLETARSVEDKRNLINGLVIKAENASAPARREIMAQLDKHWADADINHKLAIARLHILDARDRLVGSVVGSDAVEIAREGATLGPRL